MQESLKLIQVPNVDTSRLSSVGEFRRNVDRVQERYKLNLEFNDNARWRPGSYERLKDQVIGALFPHWSKPKGANTIRRLTKTSQYQCNQLATDLIQIDDELRKFRQAKQSLDPEEAQVEGTKLLNEFITNLIEPVEGVKVEILPLPYFARHRRSGMGRQDGTIYERNWDEPIHPKMSFDGEIIKYNKSASKIEELLKIYGLNVNPQRWFINITVPLEDVNIDYYLKNDESKVVCTNPYGELVICFSVPLYDAILNYRQIKMWDPKADNQHSIYRRLNHNYYTNHTYSFPYVPSIQHPYVQRGHSRYCYDMGNTCFGDFKNDVMMAISTGMMGQLRAILTKWASTYYLGNTTPLNQTDSHHIGMPKEWVGTAIPDYMGTSISLCRELGVAGMKQEQMLARFCSKCALSEKSEARTVCDYYLRLTKAPIEIPAAYLAELDNIIESQGLPGLSQSHQLQTAKATIQAKATEMWNLVSADTMSSTDSLAPLWRADQMGTGNIHWETFETICDQFIRNVLEYDDFHDNQALARDTYLIYRYMERVYWLNSIGTYHDSLRDEIEEEYFTEVAQAEEAKPVSDYRSMVNTHRLSHNQSLYPEYLDILKPNSERTVEMLQDDTLNAWLHANDEEAERGPTNERNPF